MVRRKKFQIKPDNHHAHARFCCRQNKTKFEIPCFQGQRRQQLFNASLTALLIYCRVTNSSPDRGSQFAYVVFRDEGREINVLAIAIQAEYNKGIRRLVYHSFPKLSVSE